MGWARDYNCYAGVMGLKKGMFDIVNITTTFFIMLRGKQQGNLYGQTVL